MATGLTLSLVPIGMGIHEPGAYRDTNNQTKDNMKTIRNTMTTDDREPYIVGGEGTEKVKILGTRMAARYAYDHRALVVDCEGARYDTALDCVTWGRPILVRA